MTSRRLQAYLSDIWDKDTVAIRAAFTLCVRGCQFGREETRERYFYFRYGWIAALKMLGRV